MPKLTLSVNQAVISRAKRYAGRTGVSVSRMVEAYLASVSEPPQAQEPPILHSLRGTLRKADGGDYRDYLAGKYR